MRPSIFRHRHLRSPKRRLNAERLEGRYVFDATVVFNEIMYNPLGEDVGREWIELHNQMSVDMDISGWRLDGAVHYDFPEGTVIPGHSDLVIAADPARLMTDTGLSHVLGPFVGSLDNGGETLQLYNNYYAVRTRPADVPLDTSLSPNSSRLDGRRLMDEVQYDDGDAWPVEADGSGASLAKRDPDTGSRLAESWTFSPELGGTPGARNFPIPGPQFVTQVTDSSGHKNHGNPTVTRVADQGFEGQAGQFDGSNSYVALPIDMTPAAHPQLTIGAWIHPDTSATSQAVLSNDDGGFDRLIGIGSGAVYISPAGANIWNAFNVNGHDRTSVNPVMALVDRDGTATNVSLQIDGTISGFTNARNATIALVNDYVFVNAGNSPANANWRLTGLVPGRAYDVYAYGGVGRDVGMRIDAQGDGSVGNDLPVNVPSTGTRFAPTLADGSGTILGNIAPGTQSEGNWSGLQLVDTVTGQLWSVDIQAVNGPVGGQGVPLLQKGPLPTPSGGGYSAFAGGHQLQGSGVAVDPTKWAFLSAVYDETTTSMTVYLDADARSTNDPLLSFTDTATSFNASKYLANIGRRPNNQWYFDGLIDNVFLIDRALSSEQVASLRSGGAAAAKTWGENLLGLYEFEDAPPSVTPIELPTLAINEVSSTTAARFQVEISNHGAAPINLRNYVLATNAESHPRVALPDVTIAAGGLIAIDQTQLGFRPQDGDALMLYAPNQSLVIDAVHVDNSPRARQPDHVGPWMEPTTTTFGESNRVALHHEIVINEIMYHGYPERAPTFVENAEEWIELYNRSNTTVDLTDWHVAGGVDFAFPPATRMAPDSYLLIAKDATTLAKKYPSIAGTIVGSFSGSLADSNDRVQLLDPLGNVADDVHYYDSGRWPESADGGGASLELRDPQSDNGIAEAWGASDERSDTSWQTVTYRGVAVNDGIGNDVFHELVLGMLDAGEILIDDLHVVERPGTVDAVEFLQNGSFEADGIGTSPAKWRILGNHQGIVESDPFDATNHVLHITSVGATEDKHNHAETTFANGQHVTVGREYEISFRAKWLTGSNQLNSRLYFNFLQQTTLLDVSLHGGTPGRVNSQRVPNAGPTYTSFQHAPIVPTNLDSVRVSVHPDDAQGIARMTLNYAVNDGAWQSLSMTGTSGGDYTGTIPPQIAGAVVQFYVEGEDSAGAVSTFPAEGRDSRALYVVDDGQASLGLLHNVRIVMTPADREFMYRDTNRMSNAMHGATVIYDEREVFYDVGARLKGSGFGRFAGTETGFKMEFDPDHLFRGVHPTIDIERAGNKKEALAMHMLGRAGGGLPSFYDDVVRVIAPRSAETGIGILAMARYSDVFLDESFPNGSEGALYNMELLYNPNGTVDGNPESLKLNNPYNHTNGTLVIADHGDDKETYRWNYQMRNARSRDNYDPLIQLSKAFSLTGEALDAATRAIMDVDQWMRTWAMLSLNGNDDIYTRVFDHNFRMYVRPTDGKIIALPWDLDRAFQIAARGPLWGDENLRKVIELPANKRLYFGHLLDMVNSTANTTYMATWTAHLGELTGQNFAAELGFIGNRANYVLSQLPVEFPWEVTTSDPIDVGAATTATIGGRAWINVREIRLQGHAEPLPVKWSVASAAGTTPGGVWADGWEVQVPVDQQTPTVTLEAYDFQGRLIGSRTMHVTSSGHRPIVDQLRVVELMYNPSDSGNLEEYIELMNVSTTAIPSLAGVQFAQGIRVTLPDVGLAAGERAVIVRDVARFRAKYGDGVRILASYDDSALDNGGELLRLVDAQGVLIQEFTYDDSWYANTDGAGMSLEFYAPIESRRDLAAWNRAESWAPSATTGGTPGRAATLPGDVNFDGRFDSSDFVIIFQAGEYEDHEVGNSIWTEGDWNGDHEFDTRDLVYVFTIGLYKRETRGEKRDARGRLSFLL